MKKNVGTIDKSLRITIALIIAVLLITQVITGIFTIVFMVIAVLLFLTSLFGICPLYKLLGIQTGRKKEINSKMQENQ